MTQRDGGDGMTKEITIGALRLAGEPCCNAGSCDRVVVSGFPGGDEAYLSVEAWSALLAVAAVVEAAKEWRANDVEIHKCIDDGCIQIPIRLTRKEWPLLESLRAAINAMTPTSSRGSK